MNDPWRVLHLKQLKQMIHTAVLNPRFYMESNKPIKRTWNWQLFLRCSHFSMCYGFALLKQTSRNFSHPHFFVAYCFEKHVTVHNWVVWKSKLDQQIKFKKIVIVEFWSQKCINRESGVVVPVFGEKVAA